MVGIWIRMNREEGMRTRALWMVLSMVAVACGEETSSGGIEVTEGLPRRFRTESVPL